MTASTLSASNAWILWFNSRESAEAINMKNQEKLFSTFNFEISKPDCIDSILKHHETVFLQKINFGSKKVSLFHHLVAVGGTIYDSESKQFGFIQGVGKSIASNLTPDIDVLSNIESATAVNVPTNSTLFGLSDKVQVDSLITSHRNKFRPRNFIPVPPFLLSSIHDSILISNGDAKEVLVTCVAAIKQFDEDHIDNEKYQEKAKEKCKEILYWLYLVSQDNDAIAAISTTGCNSEIAASALDNITRSCLQPTNVTSESVSFFDQVEKSLKRPFEVLAASSSSTSDFMEKLTQLQSQNNEKSSKSFKKIPTKYQNMILVASSVSEITTLDYNADGSEFFKCSSILSGQVMLNSLLESEGIDCSVSTAMTSALMLGSFLWKDSISPSGFASSVLSSENFIRSDTLHEGMILDYATKFDMSEKSLKKLTKTQVLFPTDIEDLIHRLRGFHALSVFFFKKTGFVSQGLKKILNFCLDNKSVMKTRIFMDQKFIAKFICAIDERIYHWLRQCSMRNSVVETDVTLVEFSSLISDVQLNRFSYILPPSVSKIISSKDGEVKDSEQSKKTKVTNTEMVRNSKICDDWKLRASENWATIFRNKTIGGPMLSYNCKPCLKYQVKGVCYDDCTQKRSHCVLVGEDRKQTDDYIKLLRGE